MIAGHVGMVRGVDDRVVSAITGAPPARLGSVMHLFVEPIARGRQLGASLLGAVHAYAATDGLQLMLDVVDDGSPRDCALRPARLAGGRPPNRGLDHSRGTQAARPGVCRTRERPARSPIAGRLSKQLPATQQNRR
jgi:GNAT superfamily N-acetyltransferase